MRNLIKKTGILIILLIIGLIFLACKEPDTRFPLTGTVSINGAALEGHTLTANTGDLEGDGIIFFQWKRSGTAYIGINSSLYNVTAEDVGYTITVTVTRSGNSGSVTSAPTATIIKPQPNTTISTSGLAFTLINDNTAYSVSKGTADAAAVIIPNVYNSLPVTMIAYNGFLNYTNMTSVTIPDSVTIIGSSAFSGCTGLTSISIPDSVTSIGSGALSGCTGLISISIPFVGASLNSMFNWSPYWSSYQNSFGSTTSFGYIFDAIASNYHSIPASLQTVIITGGDSIGFNAFANCSSLTSVTIPNSVTFIGSSAFSGCSSLTSVTIPNSVTSIGSSAFSGCSSLTSVTIPNSVTFIDSSAFYNCSSLTSINLNSDNPNYILQDGILYNKNKTNIIYVLTGISGSIIIPNSVTSIDAYAFQSRLSLISVTIPNSVTSIGFNAFENCSSLTSVTIPNSVTSIGSYAFYGCSSLTSIIIPNSVTSIGYGAFYGCSGLTSVTIPNSVTSIDSHAFSGCSSLTSVTIPNSVTSIDSHAFSGCSSLTSVTIPNSVTSIDSWAFSGCWNLTTVFYSGANISAWNEIVINENNYLTNATLYYYSATNPGTANTHWRYVDGIPSIWN